MYTHITERRMHSKVHTSCKHDWFFTFLSIRTMCTTHHFFSYAKRHECVYVYAIVSVFPVYGVHLLNVVWLRRQIDRENMIESIRSTQGRSFSSQIIVVKCVPVLPRRRRRRRSFIWLQENDSKEGKRCGKQRSAWMREYESAFAFGL